MEILVQITEIFMQIIIFVSHVIASIVIILGIFRALRIYVRNSNDLCKELDEVRLIRIVIGNSFILSLSILVGTSILKTALNPTWNDIGMLAAIILLRSFLNYMLLHNVKEDQQIKSTRNR